ncbi:hypothetical protein AQ436_11525 [Arthrobacter sp. EpRS66]|uniref:hypothetical protein n=1 Tax=Glutamicibacter mishrai TaxID=1775880 RepID=UPI000748004E|nr:hypothetical protein AQ436_11525 [Arthrobacter sp. EpRS66]
MASDTLYIISETIPNWLMAGSAVAAVAVFWWRKQDKKEQAAQREEDILNGVNAVWVKAVVGEEEHPKWGVLVSNDHPTQVTNVRVECNGNRHTSELLHPNVQPGQHFFESMAQVERGRPWALPTANISRRDFITGSQKYETKKISFTFCGKDYSKALTE